MSVELFRITDADVLRAKDVWESQCGMVELIGPQMATFHYHSASPFFVAKFELSNHRLGGLFLLLTMAQFGGSSNLHAAIPSSRQAGQRYAVYFLFLC
jgi:hypothetical protein